MKLLALIGAMVCMVGLAGCSSPYLPHNAFFNLPEFSQQEENDKQNSTTEQEQPEEGGNDMEKTSIKSYFSPGSIRERYVQHIQNDVTDCDLLLDIAGDTVELMRWEGKREDEIRSELKKKFHFSDEMIDKLMKK